jgi:hypothetical protein
LASTVVEFAGTIAELESNADKRGITITAKYLLSDMSDVSSMLTFFTARRGRNNRFWLFGEVGEFFVKNESQAGLTYLECEPNGYEDVHTTDDRIYLRMANGDIITRQIDSAVYDESEDLLTLSFTNGLDRDIVPGDAFQLGRLYKVRFDIDTLRLRFHAAGVAEVNVRFHELPLEY